MEKEKDRSVPEAKSTTKLLSSNNKLLYSPNTSEKSMSTADYSFSSRHSDCVDSNKPSLFAKKGDTETVLGDFIVRKLIGKGSFGKVYLIERIGNPSEVFAMKSIEKTRIIEEGLI